MGINPPPTPFLPHKKMFERWISKERDPDLFKKGSFCHKIRFSNPYIFATWYRRPWIFPTMNSVYRSNNLSLNYQRFTLSGCLDLEIRPIEFVVKTYSFKCTKFLTIKHNKHYMKRKDKLHIKDYLYCKRFSNLYLSSCRILTL